ncbi:MAG TPA: translocation/assembly module TamB domain-containing protein [Rhodanobacteraceae bacterium]|nr:translocation/assembly module TamB domain-containing protein [Rhodanobacteraceae bacterium]
MKRWLKWFGVLLSALLLLVVVALVWLLGTTAGLRFALARASGLSDGRLSVQQVEGRLWGPLDLRGLSWRDRGNGIDAHIDTLHVDASLSALLRARLTIRQLTVRGITLTLDTPTTPPTPPDDTQLSLSAPLDIVLDQARIESIEVRQHDAVAFRADRVELGGAWTGDDITLTRLALTAPEGQITAHGTLNAAGAWRGDGAVTVAWRTGETDLRGTLTAHADGRQAIATLALTAPAPAHLDATLAQKGNHDWTATLRIPRFNPATLLGSASIKALGLELTAHGDRQQASANGVVTLDDYRIQLASLRAALAGNGKALTLSELTIDSADLPGELHAQGQVQLDSEPLAAQLQLGWSGVELPPALLGQAMASHGNITLDGSSERYHASGEVALGPPGTLSRIQLALDGSARDVTLQSLAIRQPKGELTATGRISWQPALAWNLNVNGTHFDPAPLAPAWPGSLTLALASQGEITNKGTRATLAIERLDGRLRRLPITGHGALQLSAEQVLSGQLQLSAGRSQLAIDGKPGARNDLTLRVDLPAVADWLDGAAGHLAGHATLRGKWPALALTAEANGGALALGERRIGSLALDADVPDLRMPAGRARLTLTDVHADGLDFSRVALDASGTSARHDAKLTLRGPQVAATLALHGRQNKDDWRGTLDQLTVEPQGLPAWQLAAPAALAWTRGNVTLSPLCLSAGDPRLCADGHVGSDGSLAANWSIEALPAALLSALGDGLPLRTEGRIDGQGQVQRRAGGALLGTATLHSELGSLTWLDNPQAAAFSWHDLRVDAVLDPQSTRLEAHAGIGANGRLDAHAAITGNDDALSGELKLTLDDLGFAELFTTEVAAVDGRLDAALTLNGTLASPVLQGQASVNGFAAEIPAAGLKLHDGDITVRSNDEGNLALEGTMQSGDGRLAIHGTLGLGQNATTRLTLSGDNVQAANLPAAQLAVSPRLTITRDAGKLELGGTLAITRADINLDKLPGAGAPQASPDVVVIDRPQTATGAGLPLRVALSIDLGDATRIKGLGLDGKLGGTLKVSQRPGREATGQGQIVVDGSYRAYGQNLKIQRGRLLFASTPLDNPGLDIRATRSLRPNATIDEGQQVGLDISGTAQKPVLTVFSKPLMAQSDALSYLVTGKPLSQVKGGEGNMVGAAAEALGSAAGDLLAKGIGARLGIDAGVASNDALGGAAFTVGKYLSPKLYLSYGVGLFDPGTVITLRYLLSSRWNFEAEQATDFSRASFNYRLER